MVKVRRGKKPAAAGFDDADPKELVLKKIRSDAAKVKKTLDTLSCFRHIRPKPVSFNASQNSRYTEYHGAVTAVRSPRPAADLDSHDASPLPPADFPNVLSVHPSADYDGPENRGEDLLSKIEFRYRYGLRTAKWTGDERTFAKTPFVNLEIIPSISPPPLPPPPPPPQRAFVRRDGTLVVVTQTGDLYPPNLVLRTAESPAAAVAVTSKKTHLSNGRSDPSFADEIPRAFPDNDDSNNFVDSAFDDNNDDEGCDVANGNVEDNGVVDDDGSDCDAISSWDEESDEELLTQPPEIDVSRVELICACPYCNLSFVGKTGKILFSVFKRITPGNETEFVEEHIDRCCLRQHMGQLTKCSDCDKSYLKNPRKERNHWRKYHPDSRRACPFEQCLDLGHFTDAALIQHLISAHYWSAAKSKSFVSSSKKKNSRKPKKI